LSHVAIDFNTLLYTQTHEHMWICGVLSNKIIN
jgi:hypothetical protein